MKRTNPHIAKAMTKIYKQSTGKYIDEQDPLIKKMMGKTKSTLADKFNSDKIGFKTT